LPGEPVFRAAVNENAIHIYHQRLNSEIDAPKHAFTVSAMINADVVAEPWTNLAAESPDTGGHKGWVTAQDFRR
jgi:hypothetical protein